MLTLYENGRVNSRFSAAAYSADVATCSGSLAKDTCPERHGPRHRRYGEQSPVLGADEDIGGGVDREPADSNPESN